MLQEKRRVSRVYSFENLLHSTNVFLWEEIVNYLIGS